MTMCGIDDTKYSKTMSIFIWFWPHIQYMLLEKCHHSHPEQWQHAIAHHASPLKYMHPHKS